MNHIKPICGDETHTTTCKHHDLNYIEEMCKQHKKVAYIADGTHSIEGFAPIDELKYLQHKYGLFLYLDDSHGFSILGESGKGYVMQKIHDFNEEETVVVGSLAKAFGACGGVLLTGRKSIKYTLVKYGNPWSQYINSAGIGGIQASLKIHQSNELIIRQKQWLNNLRILDSQFESLNKNTLSPIRVVLLRSPEKVIKIAKKILERGFYTSAVFFPIVQKDMAGLRIMPRADIDKDVMSEFCKILQEECQGELI